MRFTWRVCSVRAKSCRDEGTRVETEERVAFSKDELPTKLHCVRIAPIAVRERLRQIIIMRLTECADATRFCFSRRPLSS
jgi:hypothetical protein